MIEWEGKMNLELARKAYDADPEFRALVDSIEDSVRRLQYTPSEMRAAAMLACMKVEFRTMHSNYYDPEARITYDSL